MRKQGVWQCFDQYQGVFYSLKCHLWLILSCLLFAPYGYCQDNQPKLDLKIRSFVGANEVTFIFKIFPKKDIVINEKAPWKLSLTDYKGLVFKGDDKKYITKKLDLTIPGFKVNSSLAKEGIKSGSVRYQLRSYVCTKDKKKCFPGLHEGEVKWKIAKEI